MLCLCLMEARSDSSAGDATSSGISRAEVAARLHMSHSGRQLFSPNRDVTVQARHGQHQNP